jgi:hypothetical protein
MYCTDYLVKVLRIVKWLRSIECTIPPVTADRKYLHQEILLNDDLNLVHVYVI